MSDSSDVEIVICDDDISFDKSIRSDDVDDFDCSSDDDDPTVEGMRVIKRARSELEKERRDHLSKLYLFLQQVISNGKAPKECWKRINTVSRSLKICRDLQAQENKLLIELEIAMQENWKLRARIASLMRKKHKKSASATLTRRVSNLTLSPKLSSPDKRRVSMDETKICDLSPSILPQSEKDVNSNVANVNKITPKPKKRLKKRLGLTEEEKEFYALNDKLDDLLHQVDSLWEEVKDDEELPEKDYKEPKLEELSDSIKAEPDKENPGSSTLTPKKETSIQKSPKKFKKKQDNHKFISVADISKLIKPQFLQSADQKEIKSVSKDSSEDEGRLIIDEEDPTKKTGVDVDLMEALQAVNDLCKTIIPDVDEPVEYEVKKTQSNRPIRKTRNSKPASEVIVIDE